MDNNTRISRFDQVRLLTTVNVNYLSAPPGTEISPKGIWSVAAVIDSTELLCVQRDITIKIPVADVLKVMGYDLSGIYGKLGKLTDG